VSLLLLNSNAELFQMDQLLWHGKRMVVVVGGILECPCCFSIQMQSFFR